MGCGLWVVGCARKTSQQQQQQQHLGARVNISPRRTNRLDVDPARHAAELSCRLPKSNADAAINLDPMPTPDRPLSFVALELSTT